ncbi:SPOR domain-containing protein [Rosettibacter firmus]|uniref:SPOR domain-containing protein n=1 Tax=Rosettibacter firmus TaxID=3111522 RepID=UPI00336C2B4A
MTISDLQTKIAEALGVSVSEKELAYEIFISRIASLLTNELTIKIPGIGFFQLKKSTQQHKPEIIYIPLQENYFTDVKNTYIELEVPDSLSFKNNDENLEDIFSIGVGKPYIPLEEKVDNNIEASFLSLRKSIEERVEEIISEAENIPGLNLIEEYEKHSESEPEISTQEKLSELTSDLQFEEKLTEVKEDILAESITKSILEDERSNSVTEKIDESKDENLELTPTDLLQDYKFDNKSEDEKSISQEVSSKETSDDTENNEIEIELGKHRKTIDDEIFYDSEINSINTNHDVIDDDRKPKSDYDEIIDSYLGLKKKTPQKIEWNWGDELREELESYSNEYYSDKKLMKEPVDFKRKEIENEKVDDILKTTRPVSSKLFEELESTIKKEIEKVTKEISDSEKPINRTKYEFVEVENEDKHLDKITHRTFDEEEEKRYYSREYGNKENYFGKTFIILFLSFVILSGLIVYLFLPNKNANNSLITSKQNVDSSNKSEELVTALPETDLSKTEIVVPEENDFPRVPVLPSTKKNEQEVSTYTSEILETTDKSLYRNILNDTRINKNIYFDGKSYNVQVSSWRNRLKAEQEVKRLRNEGYDAFVLIANLPEKGGIWYRVRIGSFKSLDEAKEFSSKNNY